MGGGGGLTEDVSTGKWLATAFVRVMDNFIVQTTVEMRNDRRNFNWNLNSYKYVLEKNQGSMGFRPGADAL